MKGRRVKGRNWQISSHERCHETWGIFRDGPGPAAITEPGENSFVVLWSPTSAWSSEVPQLWGNRDPAVLAQNMVCAAWHPQVTDLFVDQGKN